MMTQFQRQQVQDVTILRVQGRMTLGEGNLGLRHSLEDLLARGSKKVVLDLMEVDYMDSSGLGELVRAYHSIRKHGAQIKLMMLTKRVRWLLQITRLTSVFDIQEDQIAALASFDT